MGFNSKSVITQTVNGVKVTETVSVSAQSRKGMDITKAVAKTSTLTTRTDANTGVLTVASGHGVTTSHILGLTWTEGGVQKYRHNMTVSAQDSTTISIDGGSGDDLPADETSGIVFSVRDREDCNLGAVTYANWKSFILKAQRNAMVVLVFNTSDYKVLFVTSTAPVQFNTGMCRSLFTATVAALFGSATTDILKFIDVYNMDTTAGTTNRVQAELLHD